MPQNPVFPDGADIRSYAFSKGDGEDWQVESNLMELGISQFDQKIEHLSGGQKRRVVLAKTLAEDFDVLLLDEPTKPSGRGDDHMAGGISAILPGNCPYGDPRQVFPRQGMQPDP